MDKLALNALENSFLQVKEEGRSCELSFLIVKLQLSASFPILYT